MTAHGKSDPMLTVPGNTRFYPTARCLGRLGSGARCRRFGFRWWWGRRATSPARRLGPGFYLGLFSPQNTRQQEPQGRDQQYRTQDQCPGSQRAGCKVGKIIPIEHAHGAATRCLIAVRAEQQHAGPINGGRHDQQADCQQCTVQDQFETQARTRLGLLWHFVVVIRSHERTLQRRCYFEACILAVARSARNCCVDEQKFPAVPGGL